MLQLNTLTWIGVILFGSTFFCSVLTLPVELNASARAKELLVSHGIIQGGEQIVGVEKVLGAAAWTYVAASCLRSASGCSMCSLCSSGDARLPLLSDGPLRQFDIHISVALHKAS
jgi:Zn-dependent membrane protease YugP